MEEEVGGHGKEREKCQVQLLIVWQTATRNGIQTFLFHSGFGAYFLHRQRWWKEVFLLSRQLKLGFAQQGPITSQWTRRVKKNNSGVVIVSEVRYAQAREG